MSKINDGGPAFPVPFILDPTRGTAGGEYVDGADAGAPTGVTMRDFFAAKANLGDGVPDEVAVTIGGPRPTDHMELVRWSAKVVAEVRYIMADAMLAARQTGGGA